MSVILLPIPLRFRAWVNMFAIEIYVSRFQLPLFKDHLDFSPKTYHHRFTYTHLLSSSRLRKNWKLKFRRIYWTHLLISIVICYFALLTRSCAIDLFYSIYACWHFRSLRKKYFFMTYLTALQAASSVFSDTWGRHWSTADFEYSHEFSNKEPCRELMLYLLSWCHEARFLFFTCCRG